MDVRQDYQVPPGPRHIAGKIALLWILAVLICGSAITALSEPTKDLALRIAEPEGGHICLCLHDYSPVEVRVLFIASSVLVSAWMGLGAALALRLALPEPAWRLGAIVAASWFLAGAAKLVLDGLTPLKPVDETMRAVGCFFSEPEPLTAPVVGLVIGIVQRTLFDRYSRLDRWWILASVAGFAAGEALGYWAAARARAGGSMQPEMAWLSGLLLWVCYALITGFALWRLVRAMEVDAAGRALPIPALPAA